MPGPPQVGLQEVLVEREPPVPRRIARTTAANTDRRCDEVSRPLRGVAHRLRQPARLLLRADLGHDDAHRADTEELLDDVLDLAPSPLPKPDDRRHLRPRALYPQ